MSTELRFGSYALLALVSLVSACSSCNGDSENDDAGSGADTNTDSDADTDTDTDSDSETGSEIEFGETTPCVNEPREGEVCVPGGNYLMGCVPGDTECEDNEKPLVMTTLSPFFADVKEATISEVISWVNDIKDDPGIVQYPQGITLMDETGEHRLWGGWWDIGVLGDSIDYAQKDTNGNYIFNDAANTACPNQGGQDATAGGFSWLGAKMFCEWKGMHLPTEAQWEAAARGQTTHEFPCGSNLDECWWGIYACCWESEVCYDYYSSWCHCCAPFDVDDAYSCISPFGITGMYGNADEWTSDYVSVDHSACNGGCTDPQPSTEPPYEGAGHVYKGGSMYGLEQSWLRISHRWDGGENDNGGDMTGVRCVRPDEPIIPMDAGA